MSAQSKRGRPKATDKPDVVSLLVGAFRDGMTVRQACIQSGISHEAYYLRCRQDADFADKMYYAQQTVLTAARRNVIKAIKGGDLRASQWWLEKHNFAKPTEEPPPAVSAVPPDPIKGKALIDRIRAYEQEILGLQQENPHDIGEP
jgi:hypothetical protein